MFKKFAGFFILVILLAGACAGSQIYELGNLEYENLGLTPGPTAEHINFNWLSNAQENKVSLVRLYNENGELLMTAIGEASPAFSGAMTHRVSVEGLEPNTEYSYSISSDGISWSTRYNFRTANTERFRFAAVADPQLTTGRMASYSEWFSQDGTTAQAWKDTVSKIAAENVDLIVGLGDQVDQTKRGNMLEYLDLFAPIELRSIPFAPTVGNHDRHYLFQYHFNLPNEQQFDIPFGITRSMEIRTLEAAGNYWFLYNNALFVVLNNSAYPVSTRDARRYIDRFDQTLAAAVNAHRGNFTWLFVMHHKSTTVHARHIMSRDRLRYVNAGFEELMDKYNVDIVLSGHYHIYNRGFSRGTTYLTLNTAAGSKYYDSPSPKNLSPYTQVNIQARKPQFTIIEVEDRTIHFRTYNIDSDVPIDAFTVEKRE